MAAADALYRSTNGGDEWQRVDVLPGGGNVRAMAVSPAFPEDDTLLAANAGGIHRSTNGGADWEAVGRGLGGKSVTALALSPSFQGDSTMFAGTESSGLFLSTDAGASWHRVGAVPGDATVFDIALSPTDGDHVVLAATERGLFRGRGSSAPLTPAAGNVADLEPLIVAAVAIVAALLGAAAWRLRRRVRRPAP